MSDTAATLRSTLEDEGYDVREVTENRSQLRVALGSPDAPAAALREVVEDVAGDRLLGVDVSTEHAGSDAVGTVLSVRLR